MKRIIWLPLAILAATVVSSCQEEMDFSSTGNACLLTATIDPDAPVRTSLSPSSEGVYKVLWTAEDRIGVYADNATEPALFRLVSGEGAETAEFSGPIQGTRYQAVYPWSIAGKVEDESISIVLPEEQDYSTGTFAPGSFPMIASGTADRLSFKNLCSVLQVSITGHQSVTALEFLPKDPTVIVSGPAKATLVDGIPQLTLSSEGNRRVILNVGNVLLNEDVATAFYLVLPPRTYQGGFTVRIHTSGGSMDKVYGEDFTMERSRLHQATPFVLKQDQGVEPSLQMDGNGTIEDPFLVRSLSDLLLMQAAVNTAGGTLKTSGGTSVTARSAAYRLTSDIDLAPVCGASSGKSWRPVGETRETSFIGVFDGDGHSISNLYIQGENDYQGLFGIGYENRNRMGKITGLSVSGQVHGASYVGMIVGHGGEVSSCSSDGEVVSDNDSAGGIAGIVYTIDHCTNRASVRKTRGMVHSVGGIAGTVSGKCHDCRNEGAVTSVEGYEIGGIVGYNQGQSVFNCSNTGIITGGQQCGGIAGISTGILENCLNEGDVSSGYGYCGGIAGVLDFGASLRNCVNIAQVTEESYGTGNGGICGYARGNSSIEYAYHPGNNPLVASFQDSSATASHFFTFSRWDGNDSGCVLYTTEDGFPCLALIDALNAWASESRTGEKPLCGWEYDTESGTGRLTGLPATNPAGNNFLVTVPASLESGPEESTLEIRVASRGGFNVTSTPDWVKPGEKSPMEGVPDNWMQTFTVNANPGARRSGEIIFTGGMGKNVSVSVTQYGTDEFDWSQSFYHRSLFFVYTCAPDSFFDPGTYENAAAMAEESFPDRILHAALFRDGVLASPQSIQMFDKNGIFGWPALLLDGYIRLQNGYDEIAYEDMVNAYRQNETRESVSTATIRPDLSGRKLTMEIQGYFKKAGPYKIHVMLLEDGLVEYGRTNNHIVRSVLSDETGDPFTIDQDRTEKHFTFSTDIPAKYNLDKMSVLVYFDVPITGSTYRVDNAFKIPVKE